MEAWLVWITDGQWGDPELQGTAHRRLDGAKGWCNDNRKLERGTPITWKENLDGTEGMAADVIINVAGSATGGAVVGKCTVTLTGTGGKTWKEQRSYTLQPVRLEELWTPGQR